MAKRALVVLRLPIELKQRLDALRARGYTINGFTKAAIEQALNSQQPTATRGQKGRP